MCIVSNIGDSYKESFPDRWPQIPYNNLTTILPPEVSKEEFEALKKEVKELKKLLLAAKKFDEKTGQKDCEMSEKVEFIKQLAKFVGVDMKNILP